MLQTYRARILVILACLICFLIFWWVGEIMGFPGWRIEAATLLGQSPWWAGILELIVTGIVMWICVGIGFLIAGRIREDAGLLAASAGLAAMSIRGGTLGDLLRGGASGPGVFWILLIEAVILFLIWAGAWEMQRRLHRWMGWPADSARDNFDEPDESLGQKLTASVAMALAMIVVMSLLCQTDAKAQTLCSVALAALIAATIAHTLFPVRPSAWYWGATLLVGVLGYLVAYVWPDGWRIGLVGSQFGALARPMPLDYAAAGPAGALLGYWLSRQWHTSRAKEEEGESQPA